MTSPRPEPSPDIHHLLALMAALRDPQTGCPWDVAQSFATIAPYTIEEAYEVADAIARGDRADLRDELGDLLLQVVFHARMAEEEGSFAFGDVVQAISAKLIRRHPHVFGEEPVDASAEAVEARWREIKAAERAAKSTSKPAAGPRPASILDGVAAALPALLRADKLSRRAAEIGFVWQEADDVLAKIDEELAEVRDALGTGGRPHAAEEIGDLLFTVANLARHLDIDPETALRGANAKFERRFRAVEAALAARGRSPGEASLAEMEALWSEVKRVERTYLE